MDATVDDFRKKRDSAQVAISGEKSKKVRVHPAETKNSSTELTNGNENKTSHPASPKEGSSKSSLGACGSGASSAGTRRIWDIESALQYVTQTDTDEKEYLSRKDESPSWVTFRAGHAGDASTIASWYLQSDDNPELEIAKDTADTEDDTSSSMLEVWLADGLGDEGNPPAVHALLGHIQQNSTGGKISSSLAVVVLLTLDWKAGKRTLRVQWMQIDPRLAGDLAKVLEQRTWLRISVLAQMVACQVVGVQEEYTRVNVGSEVESTLNHPVPSAE
mmetsp:Transcript_4822/g.14049  ORF Transcript_4822/g.14049 Transcript_4822/m.14049 type:complete len:275 (-) Transcript_4822:38-862(-)